MSIDNIPTYYTNLTNPLVTKSVVVTANPENGTLTNGSTVECSGVFGSGNLISNIQSLNGLQNIIITANGSNPTENGVLVTIPPGIGTNNLSNFFVGGITADSNYIYAGGAILDLMEIPTRGIIYKQTINNTGGEILADIPNCGFTDIAIDSNYIYAVGAFVTQKPKKITPLIYRQPKNGGQGQAYTLDEIGGQFNAIFILNGLIYTVGGETDNAHPLMYSQPIDNLNGGGKLYNTAINGSFEDVAVDDMYIYAVGNKSIIYRQPIGNFTDGGQQYIVDISNIIFVGIAIDGQNIYALGSYNNNGTDKNIIYKNALGNLSTSGTFSQSITNATFRGLLLQNPYLYVSGFTNDGDPRLVREPTDFTQGVLYNLSPLSSSAALVCLCISADGNSIYAGGAIIDNLNNPVSPLIYSHPIGNLTDGGSEFAINGGGGGGSINYVNPLLSQDSTLSITNAGTTINLDSIDLLVTYIE